MSRFNPHERANGTSENQEFAETLELAYEKAQVMLSAKAVDMRAFKNIYSKEEIERDEAQVADLEKKFAATGTTERERRDKKFATVVEAFFFDMASRNGWLGADAEVLPSSKYDDYVNGVDCFAGYKRGGMAAFLAMAIDATWSSHPDSKFNRIREGLIRGKLGKMKYPQADGKPQRGREVPRVVVGASEQTLREVIKLWTEGNDEALKNHPIQVLFLQEIVDQLEAFKTFSERKSNGNREGAHAKNVAVFDEYHAILKPILEEKRRAIPTAGIFENDIVRNGIKASLFGLNYVPPKTIAE
jgi:hypothetical protein